MLSRGRNAVFAVLTPLVVDANLRNQDYFVKGRNESLINDRGAARFLNVRNHNISLVLRLFLRHGVLTRAALTRLTGLSATTITNLVAELIEEGLLAEMGPEVDPERSGAGRPAVAVRLLPERRLALGVHFGIGVVNVGLVDLLGQTGLMVPVPHTLDESAETVIARVADAATSIIASEPGLRERVVGIGVGASGLVDVRNGVNRLASRLGWRDVPLGPMLAGHLGMPVWVDNNARTMALAETLFGVGRDAGTLMFIYVGRGLGCGLVFEGRLFHGSTDGAGEVGHMTIVPSGGRQCHCGNTGCLETLVSRDALGQVAQDLGIQGPDGEAPSADDLVAAARSGESVAGAAVVEAAGHLGVGIATLVNAFNPELVVLGGLAAEAADLMLPTVLETVRSRAFPFLGSSVRIELTSLGSSVGLIGAAALALDSFYSDPLGVNRPA